MKDVELYFEEDGRMLSFMLSARAFLSDGLDGLIESSKAERTAESISVNRGGIEVRLNKLIPRFAPRVWSLYW
jgi:hypothetical protein